MITDFKNESQEIENDSQVSNQSFEGNQDDNQNSTKNLNFNNITKNDGNSFLRYDYSDVLNHKIKCLKTKKLQNSHNKLLVSLKKNNFAEGNEEQIKQIRKKDVSQHKQLKEYLKNLNNSSNILLRAKLISQNIDNHEEMKLSDEDSVRKEVKRIPKENFSSRFCLKNTVTSMESDIKRLKDLLNKKRKAFELKYNQLYDDDTKLVNDEDYFTVNFGFSNNKFKEGPEISINSTGFKLLYKKMKEFVFKSNFLKLDSNSRTFRSQKHNNKHVIGLNVQEILKIKKYQPCILNFPKISKEFEKLPYSYEDYAIGKERRNYDEAVPEMKFKKKATLSFIENQNSLTLRAIDERRKKFKNYSKSQKEKMDNSNLQKHWLFIVKKEIPRCYKSYLKSKSDIDANYKKISNLCQKEVKKKVAKTQRMQKESNLRGKRLQKEMLVFWRKRDKEMFEYKKQKDKLENQKKKQEEEIKEAVIQKKRLEFLMKQSEFYTNYMAHKLGIAKEEEKEAKQEEPVKEKVNIFSVTHDPNANKDKNKQEVVNPNGTIGQVKFANNGKLIFQSVKVEIDEKEALAGVKNLINEQRDGLKKFDQETSKLRKNAGGDGGYVSNLDQVKEEDLELERLDNPEIDNAGSQLIEAPKSFLGDLKEYQLKGLRWLDNLYEQGINGILADEMGLGKTIQAISLLAHITESKEIWGPFLIVAPSSTLYNWQQEVNKFCPSIKVLPYWGTLKDRKTLRKFLNPNYLYTQQSPFHVLITSYQLVVTDEKVFRSVKWQYMILDEAQAIKNINSQRWKILLGFNCRNRLLLTGTPIQNSMAELWALLHFIMPKLFDSHDQFQEWFSKDIEAHSQEKGELNQEQLRRLHAILKPFMLRRIKKDVENEIGPKFEYEEFCDMTERQKLLYNTIKQKLSNISDLFTSVDSKLKVENLMNLVMQFRKVCNHPEIFERNIGKVPFIFRDLVNSRTSTFLTPNSVAEVRIEPTNAVKFVIPKIIFDFSIENKKNINLFRYSEIRESLKNSKNSVFSFLNLMRFNISDFLNLIGMDSIVAQICLIHYLKEINSTDKYIKSNLLDENKETSLNYTEVFQTFPPFNYSYKSELSFKITKKSNFFNIFIKSPIDEDSIFFQHNGLITKIPLIFRNSNEIKDLNLCKPIRKTRFYIPKVLSSPVDIICSSKRFYNEYLNLTNHTILNKALYGKSFTQINTTFKMHLDQFINFKNIHSSVFFDDIILNGLISPIFYKQGGISQIELPDFERLVSDCAKLKKLDFLLRRLQEDNHRVLIFCQMTRMLDILEEYMTKRRYTYFRMDGSTNIADRRDMVNEFQSNESIFAFLLSTRAGGLGVNLTAADTVIFYDNDWNPTMDAQATDRAHRIGQKKVVSVYRLITKNTIEERILKRAKQKQNVQTTVYAGGAFKADIFKPREIVELLYGEEEVKNFENETKKVIEIPQSQPQIKQNSNGNGNNAKVEGEKQVKKKSKKVSFKKNANENNEKEEKQKNGNSLKSKLKKNGTIEPQEKAKGVVPTNTVLNKNIFSVSGNSNKLGNGINALKMDSSDDENNVIIQENDMENLNLQNYDAEDGFDEEVLD